MEAMIDVKMEPVNGRVWQFADLIDVSRLCKFAELVMENEPELFGYDEWISPYDRCRMDFCIERVEQGPDGYPLVEFYLLDDVDGDTYTPETILKGYDQLWHTISDPALCPYCSGYGCRECRNTGEVRRHPWVREEDGAIMNEVWLRDLITTVKERGF